MNKESDENDEEVNKHKEMLNGEEVNKVDASEAIDVDDKNCSDEKNELAVIY